MSPPSWSAVTELERKKDGRGQRKLPPPSLTVSGMGIVSATINSKTVVLSGSPHCVKGVLAAHKIFLTHGTKIPLHAEGGWCLSDVAPQFW